MSKTVLQRRKAVVYARVSSKEQEKDAITEEEWTQVSADRWVQ